DDHYDDNSTRKKEKVPSAGSTFFTGAVLFISFAVVAVLGYQFYMYDQANRHYEICKENLKRIGTAIELYSTDNSGHYPSFLSLVAPGYISELPTCPAANKDTYRESYSSAWSPDTFTIYCSGQHHVFTPLEQLKNINKFKAWKKSENMPQYNSISGLIDE
ncbi:MAG: hypothetical protein LWY06_11465, partial [Firmicutes bacterium]|nr:hypothetical protein [Bacillota bacterium]